ncbi:hypothetical protein TorRG33x02_233470 [Trema orientale]|uniref:Uncharacterized protein n=1 Tax=Trema orientale TaxID=63057 RepID=A0A2P5E5P4_TREOI|nr:hypothetical protein TorRG33x02_233470 [Trema orientale]
MAAQAHGDERRQRRELNDDGQHKDEVTGRARKGCGIEIIYPSSSLNPMCQTGT